jgi:putative transposase
MATDWWFLRPFAKLFLEGLTRIAMFDMNSISQITAMRYNPANYHRQSTRLSGHDYSSKGLYFVTVCVKDRACLFGMINQGAMILNKLGHKVQECWKAIPLHFPHVLLHDFVVMPNHVHGIIEICDNSRWPVNTQYTDIQFRSPSLTLGSMIRGFKVGATKWARQNTINHQIWQRGYYDHIIRNRYTCFKIVDYINRNPERWQHDMFHPDV